MQDPEPIIKNAVLKRVQARVRDEMKRHSKLTTALISNKLSIEQLIRLLEFSPMDLAVD